MYSFLGMGALSYMIVTIERKSAEYARKEARKRKYELVPLTSKPFGRSAANYGSAGLLDNDSSSTDDE